ncbi:MAG TPA: DMT family transporter [Xanthobacteraceae bacterium]|nr:DMT family transporter [Xanthobacteraceae bacterium]
MAEEGRGLASGAGLSATAVGIACGTGAALFWAAGLVAARHGIAIGLTPFDLVVHRYTWAGLAFLPLLARDRKTGIGAIGWWRAAALTLFAGPMLALFSYAGFILVPLGHGAVIQPSCATLGGLALATLVLGEPLRSRRLIGALAIVAGLMLLGAEALGTIGRRGLLGDLSFVAAGMSWATFGILLRVWRIEPTRAVGVVNVLSLVLLPFYAVFIGFGNLIAAGWFENAVQAVIQGILAGPVSIYLFARAVVLLGAGRAAVFTSLVPGFTLLIGFLALGEVPSIWQLAGLVVIALGFRLVIRA